MGDKYYGGEHIGSKGLWMREDGMTMRSWYCVDCERFYSV